MRIICFNAILLMLGVGTAHAGWSEDLRLTYRAYEIYPQVIARNDTVHVAWEQIGGNDLISYIRGGNGGDNWDALINLPEIGHMALRPDLSVSPSGIFMGWSDVNTNPVNWVSNIAFSTSVDGEVWSSPSYVYDTIHGISKYDLGTACYRDSVYVVYYSTEYDSTGYHPFIFLYSSDLGASWSQEATLGHGYNSTNYLHMARCRGTLYAVWACGYPPTGAILEVMAAISHDGGQSWSDVIQLSAPDSVVAQQTCLACDEQRGYFAVGWMDFAESGGYPGDLFLRPTTDGGYTWGPESRATHHHGVASPALAMAGDTIWAVWSDHDPSYGINNTEICFSRSTDQGTSWSQYERLTDGPGLSSAPWISYDRGKLHMVWYDNNLPPDSGLDIYYKRYDPEPDAIDERPGPLPRAVNLSAYPNPFNSSTFITYSGLAEEVELGIYGIQGQLIKSIKLEGMEGKVEWDGTDAVGKSVASGVYFARLRLGDHSREIKLIYLK